MELEADDDDGPQNCPPAVGPKIVVRGHLVAAADNGPPARNGLASDYDAPPRAGAAGTGGGGTAPRHSEGPNFFGARFFLKDRNFLSHARR